MNRSTLPYFLLLLISILIMPSCRVPQELVYKDFKNFSIKKLGFSNSEIKMELIYYNPNNFGLQLKSTDLEIWINNNYLGHTAQEYQVNIPKRGEFILPLQIEVDMKNMLKNAISSLANKEVLIKATGNVKVGKANVFKNFVVNYESLQKITLFQ